MSRFLQVCALLQKRATCLGYSDTVFVDRLHLS
jgi:hypothetical protein